MPKAQSAPRNIAPTPERLAKGDVIARQNRADASGRDAGVTYEARVRRVDPLRLLLSDRHIDLTEYAAGVALQGLYERVMGSGAKAFDYGELRRGGGQEPNFARARLRQMLLAVADDDTERQARWALVIPVICEGQSLRTLALFRRAHEIARGRIVASLQRIAIWLDQERDAA